MASGTTPGFLLLAMLGVTAVDEGCFSPQYLQETLVSPRYEQPWSCGPSWQAEDLSHGQLKDESSSLDQWCAPQGAALMPFILHDTTDAPNGQHTTPPCSA